MYRCNMNMRRINWLCYFICLVLVCPMVICRSVNRNLHRKRLRHIQTFKINEFEDIVNFEPRYDVHDDDTVEQNTDLKKTDSRSSNDVDVNYPIVTSCGKLTCEHVPDYPKELIRRAFLRFQHENPKLESKVHRTQQRATKITAKRHNPDRQAKSLNIKRFAKTGADDDIRFVDKCYVEVDTFPEEAQNENNQKVYLAQIKENKNRPKGKICSRMKSCKDIHTPEDHFWHCETDYKLRVIEFTVRIVDEDKYRMEPENIRMPNGCKCETKRRVE